MPQLVNIAQNVAILVDGNNIERSIHSKFGKNYMVNFDTLIPKIIGNRQLSKFKYFREGKNISKKLADRLHRNFYGVIIPCHKSADVPLSIEATQLAEKVDTVIIMSGDADYIATVEHLKSRGVRVEICSIRETTASIIYKAADRTYYIREEDLYDIRKKPQTESGDEEE